MNLTFDARHASPEFVILLSALEASGEAILITSVERDPLGPRIEYYNPAFARMTGYDRQEMIGQTPRILQGPRTERDLLDRMRASLASGEPFQGEAVNYRKDGSTYLVEWLVTPIRDGGGRISHWVSTQRDVTARREAEVAMRDSEARFRAFVTASSDVIYRMSPDWSELRQLDGRAFLADTAQPTAGWTAHYIHPDDQLDVRLAIRNAIRTKGLFELEHRVRRVDGTLGWTLSRAVPVLDEAGEITEWLGSAKDVTDRRCAEDHLRESEERYRAIVENARDYAIFTTDPEGRITTWPPGAEQVFGWTSRDIVGQPVDLTYVPEDLAEAVPMVERQVARDTGQALNVRWHLREDGTRVFIEGVMRPLLDQEGAISGYLKVGQDVTEKRQTADRMSVMVGELQHRTRNLIAVVSSIARETMEDTGPTEAFRAEFNDRLAALSRVQGLLSRSEVEPITMGALVRLELDALGASTAVDRVSVTGPDVVLKPSTVQTLALALHELATNARKHGALSHDRGHLSVTWRERMEDGECRVALEWTETGLETVMDRPFSGAESGGYGRELIEQALPHTLDARTSYVLRPPGVHCTIDVQARSGPQCEDKT